MKKTIVTQGCFLLLGSMLVANGFSDEPGVARISNHKSNNVERAIFQAKSNDPAKVKKIGFFANVRSKLSWKSNKKESCTTGKKCCAKTKGNCSTTKNSCCNSKGNGSKTKNACCKGQSGCSKSGNLSCKGKGCGQAGCNSCDGTRRGWKRFFSFSKCPCGCGQRGCKCNGGHGNSSRFGSLSGIGNFCGFGNSSGFGHGFGHGQMLSAPWGIYNVVYPVDPFYTDQRDTKLYSAQGYGSPVAVPLAPNVRHTYNYGWGLPSSRLTPVSRPGYSTQVISVHH